MVQDLSNVFSRTGALEICCTSYGIHDEGQCLVKFVCTKFMYVPSWLRIFIQINSLMNVARLCFLTVQRLQSVLPLQGAVNMNVHGAIDVSRQKYILRNL
jgi:hypothetical protein